MRLKRIKRVIIFIPQLIRALKFLAQYFSEFIVDGGLSIITGFQYQDANLNTNQAFQFRTVIQPDGDIVNFVPPPHAFMNDSNWDRLYKENRNMHHQKTEKLLADLDGLYTIPLVIDMILSLVLFILPIRAVFLEGAKLITHAGLLVVWVALIILFRRFVNKYLGEIVIIGLIRKRSWRAKLSRFFHSRLTRQTAF